MAIGSSSRKVGSARNMLNYIQFFGANLKRHVLKDTELISIGYGQRREWYIVNKKVTTRK